MNPMGGGYRHNPRDPRVPRHNYRAGQNLSGQTSYQFGSTQGRQMYDRGVTQFKQQQSAQPSNVSSWSQNYRQPNQQGQGAPGPQKLLPAPQPDVNPAHRPRQQGFQQQGYQPRQQAHVHFAENGQSSQPGLSDDHGYASHEGYYGYSEDLQEQQPQESYHGAIGTYDDSPVGNEDQIHPQQFDGTSYGYHAEVEDEAKAHFTSVPPTKLS